MPPEARNIESKMSEGLLGLKILTPTKALFEGEVAKVTVQASDGELGILPQHAPLIGALGIGALRATEKDGTLRIFAVYGGLLEILKGQVTILAAGADAATDIDSKEAQKELEDALAMEGRTLEISDARRDAIKKARVRLAVGH